MPYIQFFHDKIRNIFYFQYINLPLYRQLEGYIEVEIHSVIFQPILVADEYYFSVPFHLQWVGTCEFSVWSGSISVPLCFNGLILVTTFGKIPKVPLKSVGITAKTDLNDKMLKQWQHRNAAAIHSKSCTISQTYRNYSVDLPVFVSCIPSTLWILLL